MTLQSITDINVDFYDKKYILISAKQYDKGSRFLSVTCYNNGELFPVYSNLHSAYIRYRKSDGHSVFNFCEITHKGKILVELTEQMLAVSGICYADLVIVNKGNADVDVDTGEIIAIDNTAILSTMTFCIDVSETAVENSEIESKYEFNLLNETLDRYETYYEDVVTRAKSWAVGNTDGKRVNEDFDNAMYYSNKAKEYADNALGHQNNASEYADNASKSADDAAQSATSAETSMSEAAISEHNAMVWAEGGQLTPHADEITSMVLTGGAKEYANQAKNHADSAKDYSVESKRYAIGGTGTVSGEDTDNSKYYCQLASDNAKDSLDYARRAENSERNAREIETRTGIFSADTENYYLQVKEMITGLNGTFMPMGTIKFEELKNLFTSGVEIKAGYLYNIEDNFVTDPTFKKSGVEYPAGTSVYFTSEGFWDCLSGSMVAGVKGDNETSYRYGNVNITAENIGAISTSDIATVDDVKSFLGI